MWVPVVPPSGIAWYDHVSKICTDKPAKNATFYSLKDCPWATLGPWAEPSTAPPEGTARNAFSWTATSAFDLSTFKCGITLGDEALAIDVSATGEIAISKVRLSDVGAEQGDLEYVVSSVSQWPLTGWYQTNMSLVCPSATQRRGCFKRKPWTR